MTDAERLKLALEALGLPTTEELPDKYKTWILCEICYEVIAIADIRELRTPLTAEMFRSTFPRDMPAPWPPGTEFEYMLCPHCRHRFAIEDNRVRTQDGYYDVPEVPPVFDEPEPNRVPETGPWFALPEQKIKQTKKKKGGSK